MSETVLYCFHNCHFQLSDPNTFFCLKAKLSLLSVLAHVQADISDRRLTAYISTLCVCVCVCVCVCMCVARERNRERLHPTSCR